MLLWVWDWRTRYNADERWLSEMDADWLRTIKELKREVEKKNGES